MPQSPPIRVIVHPGFHKTGTSSLQSYLGANRKALKPYLTFYGKSDFLAAGSAARIYGQKPYPWRLYLFRRSLDRFLAHIPDAPVIMLSRETFSGSMPGHYRFWRRIIGNYRDVAIPLGQQTIAAIKRRFGDDVQITYLYTLREKESWIRSVYGHLLRSIHLRVEFVSFRALFPELIDLRTEAETIAKALGVSDVVYAPLELYSHRHEGPAAAVLDLLAVPAHVRESLPAARRMNARQSPALQAEFFKINRENHDKAALKEAKDRLLQAAKANQKR